MAPVRLMMFPVIDVTLYDLTSHGKHLTHEEHHFLETWKTNYSFTYMGTLPFDRYVSGTYNSIFEANMSTLPDFKLSPHPCAHFHIIHHSEPIPLLALWERGGAFVFRVCDNVLPCAICSVGKSHGSQGSSPICEVQINCCCQSGGFKSEVINIFWYMVTIFYLILTNVTELSDIF